MFLSGDDPVRLGLVASSSRPGGNVTGVAILSRELAGKRLAPLHELVPHARTIAVLMNSDFEPSGRFQVEVQAAAGALGLAVQCSSEPTGPAGAGATSGGLRGQTSRQVGHALTTMKNGVVGME